MDLLGIARRRARRRFRAMLDANPSGLRCPGCGLPVEYHTEVATDRRSRALNVAAMYYHREHRA